MIACKSPVWKHVSFYHPFAAVCLLTKPEAREVGKSSLHSKGPCKRAEVFEQKTSRWSGHSCWSQTNSNSNPRSAACCGRVRGALCISVFILFMVLIITIILLIIIFKQDNACKILSTASDTLYTLRVSHFYSQVLFKGFLAILVSLTL